MTSDGSRFWEVAYGHDCPKTRGSSLRVIQYNSPRHEAENLAAHTEHICRTCKQPMRRLGHVADLKASGQHDTFLSPEFFS